ncbi:MAG: DEAD/DEAH box helicase [Candidatus Dependentiae bacterium]|nr:DEAD/DEAH box helicase [Candidatus Dependentiae bacterium]
MITFKDLSLSPEIQKALDSLGFTNPTEIQQKAIPTLLGADKVDFLGQAQTGTGKTLAFGIPLIQKINPKSKHVQALIVAPTRELVIQIRDSLRQITKFTEYISIEAIYGGVSMVEQIQALKRGVHIVVGTPGRLNDHLRRKILALDQLQTLVLDEADTMLDMGFKEEVDEIMECMPDNRQIWLFSATIKSGINDLMRSHMKDTVSVLVNRQDAAVSTTKQYFSLVPRQNRMESLFRFIDSAPEFYGFIFCQTKILTAEVAEKLALRGYTVSALHGDMSQAQRNLVIKRFKKKEFAVLVATDVAARGIDVSDATHVINFSLPDDQESYVHRIGRTGRAGKEGIAITFVTQGDLRRLRMTANKFKFEIQAIEVPRIDAIVAKQQDKAMTSLVDASKKLNATNQFIDQLYSKVNAYSKEDLTFAMTNALYEKFLSATIPNKDMVFPSSAAASSYSSSSYGQGAASDEQALSEFFINVGEDDGISKADIANFLVSSDKINNNDIKKVKILHKHTFAVVPEQFAQEVVDALKDKQLNGKRVHINITNEVPDMSGGRGHGGGRERGGDRGGERRSFSRPSRDFNGGDRGDSRGGFERKPSRGRFGAERSEGSRSSHSRF